MATVLGLTATAVDTGGLNNAVVQGFLNARVKAMLDSYTIVGTEATGSTITLGGLMPTGAKVIAIYVYVSAAQTSLTVSVGDDASATRYASASTSLQTAGSYWYGGKNYVVGTATGDNQIVLTTGGATATAGTLQIAVLYTID